jgi:hypothetical protein
MILTTLTILAAGCRTPREGSFEGVSLGMSEAEVIEVLGQPSSRLSVAEDDGNGSWAYRWHWGDTLGTLATNAAMPDQPPPSRVWTVWFNADGRVVETASPATSRGHEPAPWQPPPRPAR